MTLPLTVEQKALVEFKNAISGVKRKDHDDHILLKWLRARRYKIEEAEKMYKDSMKWRSTNKIDSLLTEYVEPEVMRTYYPGGTCGRDKEGRPIYIDTFGKCDLRGIMASLPREDIIKALIFRAERLEERLKLETKKQGKPVNQIIQILDMDGFGRKHMFVAGVELIIETLQILDNNYPENLFKVYIINAPRLFHYGFNFIKTFLSEDTRNKFIFLGGKWKEELLTIVNPEELPVHFGGTQTDPDGDTYCTSLIGSGGDVPKECYLSQADMEEGKDITVKHIKKGREHRIHAKVEHPDSFIKLYLKSDRDLHVGVMYSEHDSQKEETEVHPIKSVQCSQLPYTEHILCEKAGFYTIIIDNKRSWWFDRNIRYHMEVSSTHEEKKRLTANIIKN